MDTKLIARLTDKIEEIDRILSQETGWMGIYNSENQRVGFDSKHVVCEKLKKLLYDERERLELEIKEAVNS